MLKKYVSGLILFVILTIILLSILYILLGNIKDDVVKSQVESGSVTATNPHTAEIPDDTVSTK